MKRRVTAALAALCLYAGFAYAQDRDELVVGLGPYAPQLHPYRTIYSHDMQILNALHEGLFSYHPSSLEPVRAHAAAFSKSQDGKTWTFTLRESLRWSDGSPITAEDYVESWRYLLSPGTKSEFAVFFDVIQGAQDYRAGKNADPASLGFRAEGERTLVVTLNAPTAYFTRLLCHMSFVPVHASLRNGKAVAASDLISSGP